MTKWSKNVHQPWPHVYYCVSEFFRALREKVYSQIENEESVELIWKAWAKSSYGAMVHTFHIEMWKVYGTLK